MLLIYKSGFMFRRSMPLFSLAEMWAKSFCSRVTQFPEMLKPRGKSQGFYFDEH